jgi:hypothetical protein
LVATSEPPPAAPEADLDELSDDVIIAQESRAHAPQPRVHVDVDPRTVVIAEDAEDQSGEVTPPRPASAAPAAPPARKLAPYTLATEPTVVIRDRRTVGSSRPPPRYHSSAPPSRDQRVLILAMCIVAALLAFSFGGALALLLARRGDPPAPAHSGVAAPERR